MALTHTRARRKQTGARYIQFRKKRIQDLGRDPAYTTIGAKRIKKLRTRSKIRKLRSLSLDVANLFDPKEKKYYKVKIKTVVENPANRHYVRRNIMTKNSIIDTEKGKARITSRPGQDGVINAVLIS